MNRIHNRGSTSRCRENTVRLNPCHRLGFKRSFHHTIRFWRAEMELKRLVEILGFGFSNLCLDPQLQEELHTLLDGLRSRAEIVSCPGLQCNFHLLSSCLDRDLATYWHNLQQLSTIRSLENNVAYKRNIYLASLDLLHTCEEELHRQHECLARVNLEAGSAQTFRPDLEARHGRILAAIPLHNKLVATQKSAVKSADQEYDRAFSAFMELLPLEPKYQQENSYLTSKLTGFIQSLK